MNGSTHTNANVISPEVRPPSVNAIPVSGPKSSALPQEHDDGLDLLLSIVSVIILLFFLWKILINFLTMWKNYYDALYGVNYVLPEDNNKFIRDDVEYVNNSNEILKTINSIKLSNSNEFKSLVNYKKKYNLDTTNYAEINNKVLSNRYDDYEYNNAPNIIHFILDIFKPTKA